MSSDPKPVTPYSGRLELPGTVIADYILRAPANPKELYLLLHGYGLTARSIFDKLSGVLPADAAVLAPNGPYPVPEKQEVGYRIGYSWYFYDPFADEYLIDHANSIRFLTQGIGKLGFGGLPVRVIGFSQGGYLAPLVALQLPKARQVIGVAARFLDDEIEGVPSFRYDNVHGGKDEVVNPAGSRKYHGKLIARGGRGEFLEDAESGHRLSPGIVALVKKALELDGVTY
jgi:predicted esterase